MTPYAFPLLIKQLLVTPVAQRSKKEIVYRDQARFTYPQLIERINRLGSSLSNLNIAIGSTVAVMDYDSNRYLECYFAVPMLGATLMKVNIRLSPEQIIYTLKHSEAETLIIHTDFLPIIRQAEEELRFKHIIYITDGADINSSLLDGEYERLLSKGSPHHEFPEFDENTRATLYYTTGTTGLPKGVYFSHRQLVLHCLTVLATMSQASENGKHSRNDVYMPLTPMFHAHAWGYPYIATLCGWKQVYPGKFDAENVALLVLKEKVSFSHCVPTVLNLVISSETGRNAAFNNWKVLIGGSGLPRALAQRALSQGIDVYCGYGMSESCPLLTLAQIKSDSLEATETDDDKSMDIRLTQGMPILMAQVRVVDEEMNCIPEDGRTLGEVVVRTPYLTEGYHANAEATASLWRGGWMHTGDMGRFDKDGYLHLADRQKDVIKSGGEWISSVQLEDLISQHPGVQEAAVIGIDDAKWGERPLALVVKDQKNEVSAETLKLHLKQFVKTGALCSYAIPDQYIFVSALSKTSVGKLDKKKLREAYCKISIAETSCN